MRENIKHKILVKAVIIADNVHKPEELAGRDVVAFSYFYDLAIEAGLISGNCITFLIPLVCRHGQALKKITKVIYGMACLGGACINLKS